ncbi:DNA replication regulator SLD2 [Fusarium albosuccineum]|uniref:DNA replication regulator SLD2 n=1 Tax=Fusarium albosuccineum TaxID=1237068 RepID=A0A8H4LK56_9HYPO|nr:DNA replication regulator SLD2 [Fusarium albosuccineum]
MDDKTKAEYESQSQQLRVDLKQWENDWAKAHKGKKPGRDDIKANQEIASKYKQYNKLRDILSGKVPPPTKAETKPRKRQSDTLPAQTPTKRTKHAVTPSKNRIQDHNEELMNTPAISRKLFSPASVTSVGPTPQRDGRVLGLFDLLVEKELGTPSKSTSATKTDTKRGIDATPSKRSAPADDEASEKLGRTPMSSSKRQRLNHFMTPLKNRDGNFDAVTPSSVSKLQFDTPAFLKRNSLPVLDENGDFDAPAPLRLPRKPFARGLSEIVASLRKVEEEQLDDDLDALRDAEEEEMGDPKPKTLFPTKAKDDVLVEDTQRQQLPLGGFDDEAIYDSPVEDGTDRNGNPMRTYKKKGQKRTTRLVKMRPTRTKRPTNMGENPQSDVENEDPIPETQPGGHGVDGESDFEEPVETKKKKPAPKKEGTAKKAVRKVNELAHANFQRLKLKNHGAKGGPGFNSRFRRRR